ncbi:uncharacterized protein E6C27_scaffold102G00290 [Cucumis melo var. makuwa]|uniref:Transposase n=1 Tax=Cucumis melo var. makuwa TaxID=1194695 RepID=A0A5A7UBH9_CUCMM|nr:uncharacterized protein E6C27_scaffold102G00290 [Cucumis melo var. makuwa]
MYELELGLIRGVERRLLAIEMCSSYTEWVYYEKQMNLYRGIDRFDEGTSSDPFHEGIRSDPFHIEETSSNLFSKDNEMLRMLHDLQGSIKHDEETAEEAGLENDMPYNSCVEEETMNIFKKLLNQAHRELYPDCSKFSSINFLVTLMHVKEFANLAHCPTCGKSRYKTSLIKGKKSRTRYMSTAYSIWPVTLIPYNLPPWKCMKESNFFMSLLILDPRSPGRKIDVYLQPLIEKLEQLWSLGVLRKGIKHVPSAWEINRRSG